MRLRPSLMALAPMVAVLTTCSEIVAPTGGSGAPSPGATLGPAAVRPAAALAALRVGYYAAPNGSPAGAGTAASPWDLATALAQRGVVQPGDTIWVRGGTYRGHFYSTVAGSPSAPVVVRQYPGERATIDGNLVVLGGSMVFWGLEVTSSDRSRPAVLGVDVKGAHTRFVNMVVHDAGDSGFGFWEEAVDAEIYGSIIYNNGRMLSGRGAAHGIYSQNRDGTKRIVDNILFNQFAYGIHIFGSDATALRGYQIMGNASFNNGTSAVGGAAPDILVGGGSAAAAITVVSNYTYRTDEGTTAVFGYNWGPTNGDLTLTSNTFVGSTNIMAWSVLRGFGNTFSGAQTVVMLRLPPGTGTGGYMWDANRYFPSSGIWSPFNLTRNGGTAGYDLSGWQEATGLDRLSTLVRGRPTGVQVHVRPNRYERGRANVIVYNWDRVGAVNVDASRFLAPGTRYEVRAAQHFYGTPVASGTYSGGPITIPITAIQPPTPIGGPVAPPGTGLEFNAYVIVPIVP